MKEKKYHSALCIDVDVDVVFELFGNLSLLELRPFLPSKALLAVAKCKKTSATGVGIRFLVDLLSKINKGKNYHSALCIDADWQHHKTHTI